MPAFEVIILELPTEEEKEQGKLEVLLFGPQFYIAANDKAAGRKAERDFLKTQVAQDKPEDEVDIDRLQVAVRPFV